MPGDLAFARRCQQARGALAIAEGAMIANADLVRRFNRLSKTAVRSSHMSRWLRDGEKPSVEMMVTLAKVLKVDVGWLHYGSATRAPAPSWWKAR